MYQNSITLDSSMLDEIQAVRDSAMRKAADSEACRTAAQIGIALRKGDKWTAGIMLAKNHEARARSLAWAV